jgi:hypothetical protein
MSGTIYAKALWAPIPPGPFGVPGIGVSGPIQSSDMLNLWWWSDTQICAFNLQGQNWLGPFDWDGTAPICVTQFSNGTVLFLYTGENGPVLRTLTLPGETADFFVYGSGTNLLNSQYQGYYGSAFSTGGDGPARFGYDPKFPELCVVSLVDGYGPSVHAIGYLTIKNPQYEGFIWLGGAAGAGDDSYLVAGGLMGGHSSPNDYVNGYLPYGYYLLEGSGAGVPNLVFFNDAISKFTEDSAPPQNTTKIYDVPPNNRTYQTASTFYDGLDQNGAVIIPNGIGNFDQNIGIIAQQSEYGGWIGPNWIMLTTSRTNNGNPASFTYAGADRTPGGAAGTFDQAVEVTYSPIGDAPLSMAGFQRMAYAGAQNSTAWFYLTISGVQYSKYNLFNYRQLRN